ncbi:MAG TPA: ankyrin repeat domain-containing protein [Streptosporangiaceae bacterium]
MPTVTLPENPDLDQLRNQARELQRAVRAGDSAALALVGEFHPAPPAQRGFALSAAQLVLARRYGFPSWARLRRHVRIIGERSWTPGAPPDSEPLPDRFLRFACLTYSDDPAADRAEAARLLTEHPELPSLSLPVAAACADAERVRAFLAADPSLATRTDGPHGWSPLLYQAYARHDPAISMTATLETARLLLAAGADPDDGRFWHGLPTPFTVLTGVFGGGEDDRPWFGWSIPFARLLLEAGADPNDGQTLYNRMFGTNDDHLVLLFEFGLGRGSGGTWFRLLGDALEPPQIMLRDLLYWAVSHDQRERIALLAANGVDVVAPFGALRRGVNPRTPAEEALMNGHRELAAELMAPGASPPRLTPVDAFIAAAMAGDEAAVRGAAPGVLAAVRRARPGLLTWAAKQGHQNSPGLLLQAGFDVNSYGRSDGPFDEPWHTALHVAAGAGDLPLAERLLAAGADPSLRDKHYRSTPLGWARYFGQQPLIDLLEPVTPEP